MNLLLDIGNSAIKWAWEAGGVLSEPGGVSHGGRAPDEALGFLADLPRAPERVRAVNVAGPAFDEALVATCEEKFGLKPDLQRTTARCGAVRNGYSDIRQLGVDRWAAIVGGWNAVQAAVCIVDAGTALTLDFVEADGVHRGGLIVPGAELMESALGRETGDIERLSRLGGPDGGDFDARDPGSWFAHDTRSAVADGTRLCLIAFVDRGLAMFARQGAHPQLVLTGGAAGTLRAAFGDSAVLRPHLVLEGLCLLGGEQDA